ncbi:MAG TPA: hypothetical protein V6C89_17850 [Drouetiella sp.]
MEQVKCPNCSTPQMTNAGNCKVCDAALAPGVNQSGSADDAIMFPVASTKWILMNITTFNLYGFFWHWKNWSYLKNKRGAKVLPIARAFFNILFIPSLSTFIGEIKSELGLAKPTYNAAFLAIGAFVLNATWKLPGLLGWVCMFSFACLSPLNDQLIEINSAQGKGNCINSKFSIANKIVIVVGGILLVLGMWGSLYE